MAGRRSTPTNVVSTRSATAPGFSDLVRSSPPSCPAPARSRSGGCQTTSYRILLRVTWLRCTVQRCDKSSCGLAGRQSAPTNFVGMSCAAAPRCFDVIRAWPSSRPSPHVFPQWRLSDKFIPNFVLNDKAVPYSGDIENNSARRSPHRRVETQTPCSRRACRRTLRICETLDHIY
jgi:hypothetical protein